MIASIALYVYIAHFSKSGDYESSTTSKTNSNPKSNPPTPSKNEETSLNSSKESINTPRPPPKKDELICEGRGDLEPEYDFICGLGQDFIYFINNNPMHTHIQPAIRLIYHARRLIPHAVPQSEALKLWTRSLETGFDCAEVAKLVSSKAGKSDFAACVDYFIEELGLKGKANFFANSGEYGPYSLPLIKGFYTLKTIAFIDAADANRVFLLENDAKTWTHILGENECKHIDDVSNQTPPSFCVN